MATRTGVKVGIIVCGAAGRMGRRIVALATEGREARIAGAVEMEGHPALGTDAGELAGVGTLGIPVTADAAGLIAPPDVTIDFSTAEGALARLRTAAASGAPIVVGATGFTPEQREETERLSASMPTLVAPNMSLGVNVLIGLVEEAVARLGNGFDCEIVELHHGRKKDAPSGTALALAAAAARAAGLDPDSDLVLAREGLVGERSDREIGVVALRGGDAAGEHTVMLLGTGERIELTHRAASRDCFAAGAVRAAAWLADKPAGLYSMRDVLGLDGAG
ncbi:MAG: 4-hydroxy-tetrahydrodipicolinate reductase [Candidatus Binatia bacterium]